MSLSVTAVPDSTKYNASAHGSAGEGIIHGLDPYSCIHLAMMLARAGRSAGGNWPTLYDDDAPGKEALDNLRLACGERPAEVIEEETKLAEELRQTIHEVRRYVVATSEALQELERVLGE